MNVSCTLHAKSLCVILVNKAVNEKEQLEKVLEEEDEKCESPT
jgi:hypothetical protein